jgi:hypothetical protein
VHPPRGGALTVVFAFACGGSVLITHFSCAPIAVDLFSDTAIPDASAKAKDAGLGMDVTDALTDDATESDAGIGPEVEGNWAGACAASADCTESSASVCDSILRVCVQCSGDAGCGDHKKNACNQSTHSCELPCLTDSDCDAPDVCDTTQGVCADCLTDTHGSCSGTSEPYCIDEVCVECRTSADCESQQLCWAAEGNCVACLYDTDCPSGQMCSSRHECK